MLLDLAAFAILTVFFVAGLLRGAVASAVGVVTLAVGYGAAIVAAKSWGGPMHSVLGLPAIIAPAAAGSLAFLVVAVMGGILGSALRSWDRERRGHDARASGDRLIGGLFGVMRGGLIVVLLAFLANWVDAAREISGGQSFAAFPETEDSSVAAATGTLVESAVVAAFDEGPGGRMAARIAARPAEAMRSVQVLLEDRRIRAVQEDQLFWTYVENGSVQSALNRASFHRVVYDEDLRRQLASLGLISDAAAEDPKAFRDDAGRMLAEVGPRLKGLKNDPELQRLARDPDILAKLEAGDTLGLLADPRIQGIASRIAQAP